MRKLLILIFAVTFTACNAPVEPQGAGFFTAQPGEKYITGSAHMIDARIVDGLVDLFYVYQLDVPSAPPAEDTE